jgi:hypothetical protein
MRARAAAPALFIVALLSACAQPSGNGAPSAAVSGGPSRYTVTATVLENAEHGPQLCHAVADSLPPQCGGKDVVGWTWDGLEHEEAQGVRWGYYRLVGTWDGTAFTLTEPATVPPAGAATAPGVDFTSPCPPPAGGWRAVDPARATQAAFDTAVTEASAMPGFAGLWIDQNGGQNEPGRLVLNIRFTGDPGSREAALRAVWGGALCLSKAERTQAELERIQAELSGPEILQSSVDVVGNRVDLTVFAATPEEQSRLDAKYGAGVIQLHGFLQPY